MKTNYFDMAFHGVFVALWGPLIVFIAVVSLPFWVIGRIAAWAGWKADAWGCDEGW